jgi:glycosyltransferase involved in cell wall biosynthesis
MKIVASVHSMAPVGGTELNVFQVTRGLAGRGHSIDLIAARGGSLAEEYATFCRSVTRLPVLDFARSTALRDVVRMTPAIAVAAAKRADVVYPNRFSELIWATSAGRLSGAPVVCHLHEIRHRRPGGFPNAHVRKFIAVSESLRSEWVEVGLDPNLIDVVYNGVSLDDYPLGGAEERARARADLGLPEDGFVVLYYGRLDAEKGVDVLLDAWGRLDIGDGGGRLLLVGSPSMHLADGEGELERMRRNEPPGCTWLPARADVVTPLHAADVVVVPSVWAEPFGRVVIEAMATGRPALASRVGGIPEILKGEFDRFLVEPSDPASLADGLRGLMGWQAREPDLAKVCEGYVRDNFSLDATISGIERVLMTTAGGQ